MDLMAMTKKSPDLPNQEKVVTFEELVEQMMRVQQAIVEVINTLYDEESILQWRAHRHLVDGTVVAQLSKKGQNNYSKLLLDSAVKNYQEVFALWAKHMGNLGAPALTNAGYLNEEEL